MWDMFKAVDMEEYKDLLFSSDAPILPHMMVFNGLVILYFLLRWVFKAKPIPSTSLKTYKFLFVVINIALLFQREIGLSEYLSQITPEFLKSMVGY